MATAVDATDVVHEFDKHWVTSQHSKAFILKWTLNDFSKIPFEMEMENTLVPIPNLYLKLFLLKGMERLYMSLINDSKYHVNPEIQISIYDCEGFRWHYEEVFENLRSGNEAAILNIDKAIYNDLHKLKDDVCILVFRFKLNEFLTTSTSAPKKELGPNYDGRLKLCSDLKDIRKDPRHVDVVLIARSAEISANKAFLSARSPTFRSKLSDSDKNSFEMDDMDPTVLQKLVDFLYVGELHTETDLESSIALYAAADEYKILDLRKMVADTLLSMLTKENFASVVIVADNHGDDYLKEGVMVFICENIEALMASETWMELVDRETKLAAQIFRYCSTKIEFQPKPTCKRT